MAKAILTLLFALQAMLPSGFCLCQFIASPADVAAEKPTPKSERGCCHHRCTSQPEEDQKDGKNQPSEPCKQGQNHLPGCPALNPVADDYVPAASAAVVAEAVSPLAPMILDTLVAQFVQAFEQPSTQPALPAPLFLSHCALLI